MSDFNEDTLVDAYLKNDDDLVEEHLKRGIKLTSLSYLFDNYYDFIGSPNKLIINLTDIDLLHEAILRGLPNLLALLLTEIQPEQKHLWLACETQQVEIIGMLLNHRMIFDKECFNKRFLARIRHNRNDTQYVDGIADEIELYIASGLEITIDMVITLIRKRLYIHDIGRFNLDFNDDFHKACEENYFWPYSPQYVPFKITDIKKIIMFSSKTVYEQLINSYDKLPTVGDMLNYYCEQQMPWNIRTLHDLPVSDDDIEVAKKYDLSRDKLRILEDRLKNGTV